MQRTVFYVLSVSQFARPHTVFKRTASVGWGSNTPNKNGDFFHSSLKTRRLASYITQGFKRLNEVFQSFLILRFSWKSDWPKGRWIISGPPPPIISSCCPCDAVVSTIGQMVCGVTGTVKIADANIWKHPC